MGGFFGSRMAGFTADPAFSFTFGLSSSVARSLPHLSEANTSFLLQGEEEHRAEWAPGTLAQAELSSLLGEVTSHSYCLKTMWPPVSHSVQLSRTVCTRLLVVSEFCASVPRLVPCCSHPERSNSFVMPGRPRARDVRNLLFMVWNTPYHLTVPPGSQCHFL